MPLRVTTLGSPYSARELMGKYSLKCEICNSEKDLGCDHNHDTGMIRGILCDTCNSRLPNYLNKRYQKRHKKRNLRWLAENREALERYVKKPDTTYSYGRGNNFDFIRSLGAVDHAGTKIRGQGCDDSPAGVHRPNEASAAPKVNQESSSS